MITIDCGPFWCQVTTETETEATFISDYTVVYGKFNPVQGVHQAVVNLGVNGRVPRGIVPILQKVAARESVELTVNDSFTVSGWVPDIEASNGGGLRPYQTAAIEAALEHRCLIIEADTGSGKSSMIIAGIVAGTDEDVLVLAPTPVLLSQMKEHLDRNGVEYAFFNGKKEPTERVVLSTFKMVANRLPEIQPWLRRFKVLVVDEVHTAAAATHKLVLEACDAAHRRIGLSGTPKDRSDGLGVVNVALTGPVLYKVETEDLIESGAISKPTIVMREFRHESQGTVEASARVRWSTRYQRHIVRNIERNELVVQLVQEVEKPALVFAQELEHVTILTKMLEARGYNVRQVTGALSTGARMTLIDQLRRGYLDVLVSSKVFEVGVDIPEIEGIVNAGAMGAVTMTRQRLGRGKRVTPDKKEFTMLDIYDRVYMALERQAAKRCAIYRDAGHTVTIEKVEGSA